MVVTCIIIPSKSPTFSIIKPLLSKTKTKKQHQKNEIAKALLCGVFFRHVQMGDIYMMSPNSA